MRRVIPGLAIAAAAYLVATGLAVLVPGIPVLTACVVLGVLFGAAGGRFRDAAKPGLAIASRRVLRIGIVLLGFSLSLLDVAALGWLVLGLIVAIVAITFALTLGVGRALRLPGDQPLLLAAGFSICGASAIGAMAGVTRSKDSETATPIALVTLCGTLAIAVLPAIAPLLGLEGEAFGAWVGASVHDVGQVVATAQIGGASALAIAVVVKLTRVALLAPVVAVTGVALRGRRAEAPMTSSGPADGAARPPIVPLFLVGFIAAMVVRTVLPIPAVALDVIASAQHVLLGLALFGLGAAIRIPTLIRTGGRALAVAAISWVAIAALSYGAVLIAF